VKTSIQREYYKELGDEVYANDLRKLDKKSLYNLIYYRVHLLNPKILFIVQPFSNADMYLVADRLLLLEEGAIKEQYFPNSFGQIQIND
jgi:ribose transport system ATP-binding protein